MVLKHIYIDVKTTGSPVKILSVPDGKTAELVTLFIANPGTATANVTIMSGDGSDPVYDYVIVSLTVPAGSTVNYCHRDLKGLRAIKDIYVTTDAEVKVTVVADVK